MCKSAQSVSSNPVRVARILGNSSTASITQEPSDSGKTYWCRRLIIRSRKGNTVDDLQYVVAFFDADVKIQSQHQRIALYGSAIVPLITKVIPHLDGKLKEKVAILYAASLINGGSRDVILPYFEAALKKLNGNQGRRKKRKKRVLRKDKRVARAFEKYIAAEPDQESIWQIVKKQVFGG